MSGKPKSKASGSATLPGSHSHADKDKKAVEAASPAKDKDKKEDKSMIVAPDRDWAAGFAANDPNKFISIAYKWRLLTNSDPKRDFVFTVSQPGAGNNASKRRKGAGGGRIYDPTKKFVNCCFAKDKESGWQAQLVTPLMDVMNASLGFGNWAGDPKNKGRQYLKSTFKEAEKTICGSAQGWEGIECDDLGRNKLFMNFVEKDYQMAEQLAQLMLTERRDLNEKYVDTVYEDTVNAEALSLKMRFDTVVGVWEGQVEEKKMSQEEYRANVAKARKQYLILSDGEVDKKALRDQIPFDKVLKRFMDDYYTPALKKRASDGMEYMTFQTKVFRSATDKEIKEGPVFPNELCKVVYDESGKTGKPMDRKLVYNQHKWDFMAQWGKSQAVVGDEKQRQADMLDDFNRPLDAHSKIALVYTLKIFTQSPQNTFGFHRQFTDIILLRGPTKEEVERAKAAQGSRVSESDKMPVPGAEAHRLTDLSTKVFDTPDGATLKHMKELIAMQAKLEVQNGGGSSTQTQGKRKRDD
jgi:hypothetical protein